MKHFIHLKDIPAKDLRKILIDAKKRKKKRLKLSTLQADKDMPLKGKLLIQMFEKSSLRTRLSFYLAIKQLGGGTITLRSNELHMAWFVDYILKILNEQSLENIVLIGAPFKENTDDLRESPSLKIYKLIEEKFKNVWILDFDISLSKSFKAIKSFSELKDNTLYVEMFPDSSQNRNDIVNKIKTLKNSKIFRIWEIS